MGLSGNSLSQRVGCNVGDLSKFRHKINPLQQGWPNYRPDNGGTKLPNKFLPSLRGKVRMGGKRQFVKDHGLVMEQMETVCYACQYIGCKGALYGLKILTLSTILEYRRSISDEKPAHYVGSNHWDRRREEQCACCFGIVTDSLGIRP